jgi:integrase/recombinase XerD
MSPLPTVLTPDEVQTTLEIAQKYRKAEKPDTRYLTLVSLLFHTGIKKNECLALRRNHIDLDAPQGPILFIRYTNPQYRYKERKITLPQEWIEVYQEYIDQYQIHDQVFPWSQRRLEYLLEDLCKEAGLNKHLSFDMCRWTCALTDWQSGMEHEKIRQKLGVSKIQWREIRLKLDRLVSQSIQVN